MPRAAWIVAAFYLPALAAVALNHQARRSWHDFWFWPGAVPGCSLHNSFHSQSLVWVTLASLAGWLVLSRTRLRLAGAGAAAQSSFSALYICLLATM